MTQEDTLVVRESRTAVVVVLFICAALAGIGTLNFGGPYQIAVIGFMLLIAFFISAVLWGAAFVTLTPEGLQIRHFVRSREIPWDEIEAWGLEYDPNGEFSIWFTPGGTRKNRYIQAAGDDTKVRGEYFRRYCGSPQTEEQLKKPSCAPQVDERADEACLRSAGGRTACTAGRTDKPGLVPCRSITRNNP